MTDLTAVRLAGNVGLGALIAPLMRGLTAEMVGTGAVMAAHLGDAVVDLVTAAFAQQLEQSLEEDSSAAHRALVGQVQLYIECHLDDAKLTTEAIAAAHFVSIRHLQKVFQAEGMSVSALVRTRRLERCRRALGNPDLLDVPISTVRLRCGFSDAAHFSRLFRKTYGQSPKDYRQAFAG